jgi:predicted transcriptional regulator
MDYKLGDFACKEYRVLLNMYGKVSKINGETVVVSTQEEIASECGLSYPTVNKSIAFLIDNGCLQSSGHKGRYIITQKGITLVKEFEKVRASV